MLFSLNPCPAINLAKGQYCGTPHCATIIPVPSNILTRKFLGTATIMIAFLATSFIGVNSASAFFSFTSGKNVQFHGVVSAKTANSLTLLTTAPHPTKVFTNSNTKYPQGKPNLGDIVFVTARVKDDTITALIVKKDSHSGVGEQYGDDNERDHHDRDGRYTKGDKKCPWIKVHGDKGEDSYKINSSTRFIGATRCEDLKEGDNISVTGNDTHGDGYIATTIIKHKGESETPENEDN